MRYGPRVLLAVPRANNVTVQGKFGSKREPGPADLPRSGGAGSHVEGSRINLQKPCPLQCGESLDDLVKQGMPSDDQSGCPSPQR